MLSIQKKLTAYATPNGIEPLTRVEYIVIHDVGQANSTAKNNVDYFSGGYRKASCHYFVDDNSIWQSVEDSNKAIHSGGGSGGDPKINNMTSIGIEMCLKSNMQPSDKTINNTLELTKALMSKHNVPIEKVVRHYDASGKECPGSFKGNNWAKWKTFKSKLANMAGVDDSFLGEFGNAVSGSESSVQEEKPDVPVEFDTSFKYDDFFLGSNRFNKDSSIKEKYPDLNLIARRLFSFNATQAKEFREYENDVEMPHRENMSPFTLRIGDSAFSIPPTAFNITTTTNTERTIGIRQSSSIKKQSGFATRLITVPVWFNTLEDINGYIVDGPEGYYFVDGLRSLIAQFRRTPFLPIENEFLNETNGIYNVSLYGLNVSTVPDFPYCLQAEIVLKEFNVEPYIQSHPFDFRRMIDWDVFRWYYQEMLKENGDSELYLKPIDFKDTESLKDISFKIIDFDMFEDENDVEAAYKSLENYILEESEQDVVPFKDLDFSVSQISLSMNNILNEINMTGYRLPTSQYMGCSDVITNLSIETTDREFIKRMNFIKEHLDKLSRENNDKNLMGFCKVENSLIQLFGVEYVFIDTIDVSTVDGFPGMFMVGINLISFDPAQKKKESLYAFRPFDAGPNDVIPATSKQIITQDAAGLKTKIRQDNYAEQELQNVNLYPDLELPTVDRVNVFLKKLKKFRTEHNIKGGLEVFKVPGNAAYVDPDFYMIYKSFAPTEYLDAIEADTRQAIMDLFECEDAMINESTLTDEEGVRIFSDDAKGDKDVPKLSTYAVGREVLTKWALEGGDGIGANINTFKAERMCVDMMYCGKRGRLVKAFPTYLMTFIDEPSDWLDAKKMWNNYYVCHSAIDISIHNSSENPNITARVSLSNSFNVLNDIFFKSQMPNSYADIHKKKKYDFGSPNLTAEMLENHHVLLRSIKLSAGTRLHIRMGYGNNIHRLPITFNGVITEVQHGLVSQVVAQSDGIELINQIMDAEEDEINSTFNYGGEPSNAIGNIMTERSSFWLNLANSAWGECSKFGIEHFGININSNVKPGQYGDGIVDEMFGSKRKIFFTFLGGPLVSGAKAMYIMKRNSVAERNENGEESGGVFGFIGDFFSKGMDAIEKNKYSSDTIEKMMDVQDNPVGMSWFNEYDIVKNIHLANPETVSKLSDHQGVANTIRDNIGSVTEIDSVSEAFKSAKDIFSRNFDVLGIDNEDNVSFFLHGKTPWDVFQNMKSIVPGFICHPHFHQFESTLFFGCPSWNVKFRNSLGSNTTPDALTDVDGQMYEEERTSMGHRGHYFTQRENFVGKKYGSSLEFTVYEHSKPYSQFHIITEKDIIDNQVKASGDAIKATNCQPLYTVDRDTPTTGKTVYADSEIRPSCQKTKLVDTNFVSNIPAVPGLAEDMARGVGNILGITPTKDKARKMAITYLMESFGNMYQGGIIVLGKAEVKPHDVIYLKDDFVGMGGMAEVREVVHSMTVDGFTTTIYPKLSTFVADDTSDKFSTYMNLNKLGSAMVIIEVLRENIFYSLSIEELLRDIAKKSLKLNALRLGENIANVATGVTLMKTLPMFVTGASTTVKSIKGLMNAKTLSTVWKSVKSVKNVKGVYTAVKTGMTAIGAASAPTIVGPVIVLIITVALDILLNGIIEYFENRNVIKAFPLFCKGRPMTAGIQGYKNLIPGFADDEPTAIMSKAKEGVHVELPENDSLFSYVMANQVANRSSIEEKLKTHNDYVYGHKYPSMIDDPLYANVGRPSDGEKKLSKKYGG